MIASAIAVAATGSTALAINLGMVGTSGSPRRVESSSQVATPPTIVDYRDVYDLPPPPRSPRSHRRPPAAR